MKTNIRTLLIIALAILLSSNQNIAQNVGIGSESFTPDPSAMFEVKSSEKGFLPPRMTTVERDLIPNPAEGLVLFNTTTKCLNYRVGNFWYELCGNCTPQPIAPSAGTHFPSATQIVWNWNSVGGADGYKYNTVNDYATASDNGTSTTYTQENLDCETEYTLYVWAYNECGNSASLILNQVTADCPCEAFIDSRDNSTYQAVQIGSQCWMSENLKYLPFVSVPANGSETVPYNYVYGYNGTNVSDAKSTSNFQNYGVLYNWASAMNGSLSSNSNPSGVQGICPNGWHLPSNTEWIQLINFLGTDNVAGGKLKEVGFGHWNSPNTGATNESGFTALPGGYRHTPGTFNSIGNDGFYYTSTESSSTNAIGKYIGHTFVNIYDNNGNKGIGFNVRCIKD